MVQKKTASKPEVAEQAKSVPAKLPLELIPFYLWWREQGGRFLANVLTALVVFGAVFGGYGWWTGRNVDANKAYQYSGIEGIMRDQNIGEIQREEGIPTFKYETPLTVTVYYEDDYSLSARLEMYRKMGVIAAGFWRLGQETPAFWPLIALNQ